MVAAGAVAAAVLFSGPVSLGTVTLDVHTFVAACMVVLTGTLSISFGATVRRFATRRGLLPASTRYEVLLRWMTLETMLVGGIGLALLGVIGAAWCLAQWAGTDFGVIAEPRILRVLVLSFTGFTAGLQLALTGLLAGAIEALEPARAGPRRRHRTREGIAAEPAPRTS